MSMHVVPNYSSDEVSVYHPVLEAALNCALLEMGLNSDFEVKHHHQIGSITPDFTIVRRTTGNIFLIIEVKRTQADVASTRYRLQAQGYHTEAVNMVENPYYCLTNLEITDLFKFASKLSVSEQIVSPSPFTITPFKLTSKELFTKEIKSVCVQLIDAVLNNKGRYSRGILSFYRKMQPLVGKPDEWHESFLPASFEYIRGAFQARKLHGASSWSPAVSYQGSTDVMAGLVSEVDFTNLFNEPHPSTDSDAWNKNILKACFASGKSRQTADDIANYVHEIVSQGRKIEGFVQTDQELAQLLSVLAKKALGRDLNDGEVVCDPAAGVGDLLIGSVFGFPEVSSGQLVAFEKERLFEEALSLRLGLLYPVNLSPENSPVVRCSDLCDLLPVDFENTKIILMNPPFKAGINSKEERIEFAVRIEELTGNKSILKVGQLGLEGVFLELVVALVPEGTVMSVVLPKRSILSAASSDSEALRNFLVGPFGLINLVVYPRAGIFEEVMKDTIVAVGIKGSNHIDLSTTQIEIDLEQVDVLELSDSNDDLWGVKQKELPRETLADYTSSGWKILFDPYRPIFDWACEVFGGYPTLNGVYRGAAGNAGLSDLIFLHPDIMKGNFGELVPNDWVLAAVRNADTFDEVVLGGHNTPVIAFCPPLNAFTAGTKENETLFNLLQAFKDEWKVKSGGQVRHEKSIEQMFRIVKREANSTVPGNTVIIPRNIRRVSRIGIIEEESIISTNFLLLETASVEKSKVSASWLLSIFGQIQFELYSVDQEGTRKLEISNVENVHMPAFENLDQAFIEKILGAFDQAKFVDMYHPEIQVFDQLWAEYLAPGETELLKTSFDNLRELIRIRSPRC